MRTKNVTIVGNCQASAIADLYRDFVGNPNLEQVTYFNDHGLAQDVVRKAVEGADLVIVQERDFNHGLTSDQLPGVEVMPFPMVLAGWVWPHANEPHVRNVPEPPFSDGPYPSQMSDSFLNRLIIKETPPEEALERYLALDIARVTSIDRVLDIYMDKQRARDAKTGFELASLIEGSFRTEALFRTPHHPNARLFGAVASQLFDLLGVPGEVTRLALQSLRVSPFPPEELPIHPGLARHFGMAFADEHTRYQYLDEGSFTFAEYVLRYMRYENNHSLRVGIATAFDDPASALEMLDQGLVQSPESVRGQRARGIALSRLGRMDEASAMLRALANDHPDDPDGHIALARCLRESGATDDAITAANRAIVLAPSEAEAYRVLAEAYLDLRDFEAAATAARTASELVPGRTLAQRLLGLALLGHRDLDGAEAVGRRIVAMEPANADYRNLLAEILEEQQRRGDAIAILQEGVACGTRNGQTYSLLGNFFLRDGNPARAEEAFAEGTRVDPSRLDLEQCRVDAQNLRLIAGGPASEQGVAALALPPVKAPEKPGKLSLYWLPQPEDWSGAIGEIERASPNERAWQASMALASTRLNFLRTDRLDRAAAGLFREAPPPGLTTRPVRMAVLGASTLSHLLPSIRVGGLRRNLWITTYEPEYGQYRQDLLDPGSGLHAFDPTAILFAFDAPHMLRRADPSLDAAGARAAVDATIEELEGLWATARDRFRCQIVQQTILPGALDLLGQNEHRLPGSPAAMTDALNQRLRDAADSAGVDLLAVDRRVALDGLAAWHDPMLWHRAKQEISPIAAPLYGDLVARLLGAAQGRSAKCLVLDLDNTIWGGVIGDDGLDGIVLGQGSALGEAFAAFQGHAAALAKRGVILAVSSKNDEANVIEAFDQHPEMVLKRTDISALVANWSDKAGNIRAIAQMLNIGLDALVFADDNPFERNLVRRELPMVAVPEMPEDPGLFAQCLSDAGYFEGLALTAEDRDRTRQYRENAERATLQASTTDLGAYLDSLEMRLVWRPVDRTGLQRVVQLIGKTNQFNLTTIRHGEDEVAALMDDPRAVALQLRLTDRFGDNGIIAVVLGRMIDGERLHIDTWLMSCRVLGRKVEEGTLAVLANEARTLGATQLIGRYRPTPKNGMVAGHYERLGFRPVAPIDGMDGAFYELDLAAYVVPELPLTIVKE